MTAAIVMALSDREDLQKQTIETIRENTLWPYVLYTRDGMKEGEMKTVNSLIDGISFEWEWLVRSDDDMFYKSGWLEYMIGALQENPDVWLLGGCRYPTHTIREERDRIYIMDVCPGNHWLMSRKTWDKFGPFYEDFVKNKAEDRRFCEAIQKEGGKVATLKNPTFVVHTGIKGTTGKGRSDYVEGYMRGLADAVGAKTNA